MATFDDGTLLRTVVEDLVMGLNFRGSVADMVCTKKDRKAKDGKIPVNGTVDTLSRDLGSVAVGAEAQHVTGKLGSVDYDMEQYFFDFCINQVSMVDMSQYDMDYLGTELELLAQYNNTAIDNDLKVVLDAETNTQAAATGVWSLTSSTPTLDLQNAQKKTPSSDLLILGFTSAQELARHPEMKESLSFFSDTGAIPMPALARHLSGILGISNIVVGNHFFNSAALDNADTVTLSYIFDDFAWMGVQRNLIMTEQQESAGPDVYRDGKTRAWWASHLRALDMVRADANSGVLITGI